MTSPSLTMNTLPPIHERNPYWSIDHDGNFYAMAINSSDFNKVISSLNFIKGINVGTFTVNNVDDLNILDTLVELESVRFEEIMGCDGNSILPHLMNSPNLHILTLGWYDGSKQFGSLVDLVNKRRNLTILNLPHAINITNNDIQSIGQFNGLTQLMIMNNREIEASLLVEMISRLQCLKSLSLGCLPITGDITSVITMISSMKYLVSLNVDGWNIADDDLSIISRNSSIIMLSLADCKRITHQGVSSLTSMKKLESLDLEGTIISSGKIVGLECLSSLEHLSIDVDRLSVRLLMKLHNIPALQSLHIMYHDYIEGGCKEIISESGRECWRIRCGK